jgi:Flp pilus assembly protein TadB
VIVNPRAFPRLLQIAFGFGMALGLAWTLIPHEPWQTAVAVALLLLVLAWDYAYLRRELRQ